MKTNAFQIISTLIIALASLGAHAQSLNGNSKKIVLDLYDQQFQGQQTIHLKQLMRNQHPHMRAKNFKLKKAVLVAKSRKGRGQATLMVGHENSYPEIIPGHPEEFFSSHRGSFHRIPLHSSTYQGSARGPWQIHLRGNIKVRRIRLILEKKHQRGGYGRISYQKINDMRVEKFVSKTRTFPINQRGVNAIKLTASTNDISVEEIEVFFGNGEVRPLIELEGHINKDGSRKVVFQAPRGRFVESVRVTASAANFFGSRGHLGVEVGTRR